MNGYVCTRAWFDFCFENPKLIKPLHHAIIHWIFEKANESEWSQEFQLPTVEACAILGITDRDTYQKGLKELIGFGAVQITQESQGRYIARWVTLENCPIYLPKKQVGNRVSNGVSTPVSNTVGTTTGTTVSTTPNKKTIETLETFKAEETLKTIHDAGRVVVENFSDQIVEEEKKDTPSKVARKVSTPGFEFGLDMPFETAEFAEAWGDWAKFRMEIRHKLTASQAKAQLEKLSKQPSESIAIAVIRQSIENGWQGLFDLKVPRQQFGQPPPLLEKGKIQQGIENTYEAAQRIRERRLQQQH